MNSVDQLLADNKLLKGHLSIRVLDGPQVYIKGSPEGFRFLAQLLNAQAYGLGNFAQGCTTNLKKDDAATGFVLSPDSVASVHLHCHGDFVATQPSNQSSEP